VVSPRSTKTKLTRFRHKSLGPIPVESAYPTRAMASTADLAQYTSWISCGIYFTIVPPKPIPGVLDEVIILLISMPVHQTRPSQIFRARDRRAALCSSVRLKSILRVRSSSQPKGDIRIYVNCSTSLKIGSSIIVSLIQSENPLAERSSCNAKIWYRRRSVRSSRIAAFFMPMV
jgi:hypothetical protein